MPDRFTPVERSAVMRAVRSADTTPELAVRRLVHALGFRYRLHDGRLPGRPDLAFPGRHKVIFVHGCFWHRHACPAGRLVVIEVKVAAAGIPAQAPFIRRVLLDL